VPKSDPLGGMGPVLPTRFKVGSPGDSKHGGVSSNHRMSKQVRGEAARVLAEWRIDKWPEFKAQGRQDSGGGTNS